MIILARALKSVLLEDGEALFLSKKVFSSY